MPRCNNKSPPLVSANRYLPRLRRPSTCWPTRDMGSQPRGQRNGLPRATAWMRAPVIPSAKLRRVTSTSGNSGIYKIRQGIHRHGLSWPNGATSEHSIGRIGLRDDGRCLPGVGATDRRRKPARDAKLFYEIFLGELTTRMGDPGAGYALMLEAARRSADGQLYQRAADIALQSRSGEHALAAARAWKQALPQSREANRYLLPILVALTRIRETPGLVRQELEQSSARDKLATLSALPRMYERASDKALVAKVAEQALADELGNPATGSAAWVSLGRLRLAAGDKSGALDAAHKAQELDNASEGAVQLALELMQENIAQAEPIVLRALAKQAVPRLPEWRMAYARVLAGLQRNQDARGLLEAVTQEKPALAPAWLLMASLQFQDNRLPEAETSLQRFLELSATDTDEQVRQKSRTQAYLLYAQIAEKKNDFAAAQTWLGRIDDPQGVFGAQIRRASLLARQ